MALCRTGKLSPSRAALFLAVSLWLGLPAGAAEAVLVSHTPHAPKAGQAVRISARGAALASARKPVVEYQVVEPGKYAGKDDAEYGKGWTAIPLAADPAANPAANLAGGAGAFACEVSGAVGKHRLLIRYRIADAETGARLAPALDDSVPNFAWFVYDGIPAWRGARNPRGRGDDRREETFGPDVLRSVQAYHLIAKRRSVEAAMWTEPAHSETARHEYRWSGTLVSDDGTVYDHIRFRARGGVWRHAMGKNMWKFDFLKGHGFQARDDHARPYTARWSKLNLGACIQQGSFGMRGEQGMFEAAGFKLFNLAGVSAPLTHFIHFRVIDDAEESPPDQYAGDFWGLYLAVENVDEDFLRQHKLPDQSLFKIEGYQAKASFTGKDGVTVEDVGRFIQELFGRPDERWWRGNVDLPTYYSYRAVLECIHHYDVGAGKNYFFRRDPATRRWTVVPWDIDLTWSDNMYGDGGEPMMGALRVSAHRKEYRNRLREVRDLLFNPEQTGALIDEMAAVIADPRGGPTFVEADRRMWDNHPILRSRYVMQGKARPGTFYEASPTGDFRGMTLLMKQYIEERGAWVDRQLLNDRRIPPRPAIAAGGPIDYSKPSVKLSVKTPAGEIAAGSVHWRLGEITPPSRASLEPRAPRAYEITTLWEMTSGASVEVPTELLKAGRTYRVRARLSDALGIAGNYSDPVELRREP